MLTKKHKRAVLGVVASLGLAVASSGCGSTSSSGKATISTKSSVLTVLAGVQPINYNPFLASSADNQDHFTWLIYEPLVQWNLANSTPAYPWLAKSYEWSNGDRTLTFNIRPGVKWTDGRPLTSADVVFTFNLLRKYPALNTNGVTFKTVTAPNTSTVVMTFASPSYQEFYYIAGDTPIVPEHIWKSVTNPVTYTDLHPVGTGPFELQSFSAGSLIMTKNPHYWQPGLPKVSKIEGNSADTNVTADAAIENGSVQWASAFIPFVQKAYADKSPYYHYANTPTNVVSLFPNLKVYPLNVLAVRKALSLAVDRSTISSEGESGDEPPVTTNTGLLLPEYKSDLLPQYSNSVSTSPQDAKALATLKAAGFKQNSRGQVMTPAGKPLALTINEPAAYTDYMSDASIIAANLSKIGIKTTLAAQSVNTWNADVANGNFQITVHWSNTGASPYVIYDGWLDNTLTAPIGKSASNDFERWSSAGTQTLLAEYRNATTHAARVGAIHALEKVVATNLPVIPLVYGSAFQEWSTKQFTGWATSSNPYELNDYSFQTNEVVILHLTPRK
jgi:peptide/nickel transport system substrate-binding protein